MYFKFSKLDKYDACRCTFFIYHSSTINHNTQNRIFLICNMKNIKWMNKCCIDKCLNLHMTFFYFSLVIEIENLSIPSSMEKKTSHCFCEKHCKSATANTRWMKLSISLFSKRLSCSKAISISTYKTRLPFSAYLNSTDSVLKSVPLELRRSAFSWAFSIPVNVIVDFNFPKMKWDEVKSTSCYVYLDHINNSYKMQNSKKLEYLSMTLIWYQ